MKEIPLTHGMVATVDDDDFERLSKFKWFAYKHRKTFYAGRNFRISSGYGNTRMVRMHHDVIGRPTPPLVTDHIDGNGLNNQRGNLRFVSNRENCNSSINKRRTSKYHGVHKDIWTKRVKRWIARITIDKRIIIIGYYLTEEEASVAYQSYLKVAELKHKTPIKECMV